MRTLIRLLPAIGMAGLLLSGCAYRGHERVGFSADRAGYYDGYYDGSYGTFNDGYWGRDGAFYYSDNTHNWHRDDGNHFRRDNGDGGNWSRVHGSGAERDH
jgi:hypothetical protein